MEAPRARARAARAADRGARRVACASAASSRSTACRSTIADGQSARPDRPERRRQDHAVQLPVSRLYTPGSGDIVFEGALDPRPAAASHRRASASAAHSRTSRCSAPCRCSTTCVVGSHPLGRSDFFSNALRLPVDAARGATLADDRLGADRLPRSRRRARTAASPTCRSARRSASSLRARSRRGRSCCCSTSRPAGSTTGGRRARRADPAHPRRRRHHRAAGRASHEHGDVDLATRSWRSISARRSPRARRPRCRATTEVIRAYLGTATK